MRTFIMGLFGSFLLLAPFQGDSLEYTVPVQPPISLTREDANEILSLLENQLSDLEHRNYKAAFENYTAAPFREVTTFDEFSYFVNSYPAIGQNQSAIFGNVEIADNVASIEGTLTSREGKSTRVIYFFIRENRAWKIIGIEPVSEPRGKAGK